MVSRASGPPRDVKGGADVETTGRILATLYFRLKAKRLPRAVARPPDIRGERKGESFPLYAAFVAAKTGGR